MEPETSVYEATFPTSGLDDGSPHDREQLDPVPAEELLSRLEPADGGAE